VIVLVGNADAGFRSSENVLGRIGVENDAVAWNGDLHPGMLLAYEISARRPHIPAQPVASFEPAFNLLLAQAFHERSCCSVTVAFQVGFLFLYSAKRGVNAHKLSHAG